MDNRKPKLVAIMGSPHLNGNVASSVNAVLLGAEQTGLATEKYDLPKLNIKNCCGCRKCVENGGKCVLKDDMEAVFEAVKSADIVLIASPIYICQVNGYTKTFLDRLYPLTDEHHKPRFGTRKLVTLYTYGAPVPFLFRRYMKQTGKDLRAMGLQLHKTIILQGCTTIDKMKQDENRLSRLTEFGKSLSNLSINTLVRSPS